MKIIILFITIVGFLFNQVQGQKKFDSTVYLQEFKNILAPFSFSFDTSKSQNDKLSDEEKLQGLGQVWYEAKFNFANFDLVPHLNWDSAYRSFIPKVLATKDILSYYQELKKFNQLLQDGHSRVLEPMHYFLQKGNVPFVFEYIDGKVVLASILNNSEDYRKAKIGWIATSVNGVPIQEYIREKVSPYLNFSTPQDSISRIYRNELLNGNSNEDVRVGFITLEGKSIEQTFHRLKSGSDTVPVRFSILPGNIGHVMINSFESEKTVDMFDSLFSQIIKTDALIIDVRRNGGGNSNNGFEIIGYLMDKPFKTNFSVLHQYRPSYRAWGNDPLVLEINNYDWKPYKNKLYAKPVIVLTGPATYSAAEDFTGAFKTTGRGQIVGAPTGGSTGQPLGYNLPGGGLGFVCTKRDYMSDGTEFVGIGIMPDVLVKPTLKGIQQGKDEVLEKAIELIKNELK